MPSLGTESVGLLRWLYVNGSSTATEINTGARSRPHTLSNMALLGYIATDRDTKPITYTLTARGRSKLVAVGAMPSIAPAAARPPIGRPRLNEPESWQLPRKPSHTPRQYLAGELQGSNRPGSMRAFGLPSRFGDTLHYRDGRVTDLDGNPLPSST